MRNLLNPNKLDALPFDLGPMLGARKVSDYHAPRESVLNRILDVLLFGNIVTKM